MEKIAAHFSCEEHDPELQSRPARTYSVGSRPEFTTLNQQRSVAAADKGPIENIRNPRTRAFSLGSKARHCPSITSSSTLTEEVTKKGGRKSANSSEKSTSVPSLSRGSLEVVNDMMEIDFSNNTPTQSSILAAAMMASNKSSNPIQSPRSPTVSDYMEMNPSSNCKSVSESEESSTTMTTLREVENNARNVQQSPVVAVAVKPKSVDSSPYVEMGGSFERPPSSKPIAITAKKTFHSGTGDDFEPPKSSADSSQNMIFSLSLENLKSDELPRHNEEEPETPPTEPLVSPIAITKAVVDTTTTQIFQEQQPPVEAACIGDYTLIAPHQYRGPAHNYVELDFPTTNPQQPTTAATLRNNKQQTDVNNTPKPLYAQLMFPTTAAVATDVAATTKSSQANKKKK